MMALPDDCACAEARTPQLSFHDPVEIDTSLDTFTREELRPMNGLRSAPYKFNFTTKSNSVIDLNATLLDMKLMIVDKDGKGIPVELPEDEEYDEHTPRGLLNLVGHPISSLWKRIEVRINEKLVNVESSRHVAHKGVLEDWLGLRLDDRSHPQGAREKHVYSTEEPWFTASKKSFGQFNDGNVVQFVGKLPVDILRVNNYLAPRSNLTLTFHPNSSDWVIMNGKEGYKVVIKELLIHINRLYPSPEVLPLVPQWGQSRTEYYCGKFATVRDFQIPKSSLQWTQRVIHGQGTLPKFVLVGLVSAEMFAGDTSAKKRDPCYFDHYYMRQLSIRAGEKSYPSKPYSPMKIWEGSTRGLGQYYSLFEQSGLIHHFVAPDAFAARGSFIFPFNLTPDMSSLHSKILRPGQTGPLTVDLAFDKELRETVTLIVYMMYDQVISIQGESGFPVEQQF